MAFFGLLPIRVGVGIGVDANSLQGAECEPLLFETGVLTKPEMRTIILFLIAMAAVRRLAKSEYMTRVNLFQPEKGDLPSASLGEYQGMLKNEWKNVGRNELCPCGSGLKYKKCCLKKESPPDIDYKRYYKQKYDIDLKGPEEVEKIRAAGRLVGLGLDRVAAMLAPGVTTNDIDQLVKQLAQAHGAICAPYNYRGFPKSVCTSVNAVICHGIPGEYALKDGDIINVDITYVLDGYYADASKTFFIGSPSGEARRIVSVTAESLLAAMEMLKPGNTIGDIGWAIQDCAEGQGCSVVREFVGHGLGTSFHEPPQVPHFGRKGLGITLVPGMVFTVEPMINLGRPELFIADDGWTAITRDGKLSAQFEQTFLITEDGYESLTPYDLAPFVGNRA